MCDSCTLLHDPSKNGAAKSQIPIRATYSTMKFKRLLLERLGDAYLMTVVQLNGSYKLRAIKS